MALCVAVIPVGTEIGIAGGRPALLSVPVLGLDPTCTSGLQILTQAEIDSYKLQINTASDPERVADMASLFYAFVAVLVVVWGVKQLLNLFTGDTEK